MTLLSCCPAQTRTWRTRTSAELLPVALSAARALGAVRPSDVTKLDVMDTPCWQIYRPTALDTPGNISVFIGKGWDADEARLGAAMELIERYWSERAALTHRLAHASELAREGAAHVPANAFPLPLGLEDPGDVLMDWVQGSTVDGAPVWLPAHEVLAPYVPVPPARNPYCWRSCGLAAGSHLTEAVLHGLFEVLERDARTLGQVGRLGKNVDLSACQSPKVLELLDRLGAQGVELVVTELSALGGVSAYMACLDDGATYGPARLTAGSCAHLDPLLALEGAILEALQTRATIISGAREDLDKHALAATPGDYEAERARLAWWYDRSRPTVPAPRAPLPVSVDLAQDVRGIVQRLARQGFPRVVVTPLSPIDAAVAVVRVSVPGASDSGGGGELRLGTRIRRRASGAATEARS